MMNRLLTDLRFGLRMLLKTPGATATVLLALSLGIGLSALTYSLIDGAVLADLPFAGGDRIVRVTRAEQAPMSAADYAAWSARQRSFEAFGAVEMSMVTLGVEGRVAEPVSSASFTPSILPLLSVSPVIGRPFAEQDAAPGAPAVVLVSHDVWRDRLGSDPNAVGRIVRVDGRPTEVVGVMPEGFAFPWDQQVWSPLELDPLRGGAEEIAASAERRWALGLLREGVTTRAAGEELSAITREIDAERLGTAGPESAVVVQGYTDLFSETGRSAMLAALLLGIAFLVLLVACANVTNVLLARTVARRREVAIRVAMGASRLRIAAQLWAEISLLAAAGAAGGALIGVVGTRAVRAVVPPGMPFWIEFRVDLQVLAFVAIVGVVAALMAGLMPALQASRANTHDVLKDQSRGASGQHQGRVMRRLIGTEMAVSFVLLVLAGLFIRSAVNFYATEFAFAPEGVYTARVRLPGSAGAEPAERVRVFEALNESLRSLPAVSGVALASAVPAVGSAVAASIEVDGPAELEPTAAGRARSIVVSPGYLALFQAPVVTGRDFDSRDREDALPVAIVNDAFARRYFPEGALERRIRFSVAGGGDEWRTIVGVAPDLMAGGVESQIPEAVYLPLAQNPQASLMVLARPRADFASVPAPIREAIAALDPDIALFDVRPLEDVIDAANSQYRWMSLVFLVSGGIALFLAAIGLYGVMAFWVNQRTREIGVRMAIGGQRRDTVRLVLGQGMRQISIGLLVGVLLAIPAARLLSSALFGVAPYDPIVFGSTLAVLVAAACLGCWYPAYRATRVEPAVALLAE